MIRYLKLAAILVLFFLFSSRSCEEDDAELARQEQEELNNALNDVKVHFQANYLSEETRIAFEAGAIQKLRELADYFNIISDTSLEPSFRMQAAEMFSSLFIDPKIDIRLSMPGQPGETKARASEWIETALDGACSSTLLFIDSIQVASPLQRLGENEYKGMLQFRQGVSTRGLNIEAELTSAHKIVVLHVVKKRKKFGDEQLEVWQTYLGTIQ